MNLIKTPVKGMRDFLPEEMQIREYVINKIKNTYINFGYNIIETPIVEHIENLTIVVKCKVNPINLSNFTTMVLCLDTNVNKKEDIANSLNVILIS